MASTCSSIDFSPTKYDVFLSFRGEDTRETFTDHLYKALQRAAIHAFRDNDNIERGRDLAPELVKAIENSRASIVVLSENYVKSRWCLEELSLILEQKNKVNHFVLPVFYHVDPSDVRNQRQSFAIEGPKWTEENVNRWKSVLREVANLAGMVASGPEAEFIADIVDTIQKELDLTLVTTPAHLIGMETRARDINSWLEDKHSNTTNVLAICGMGGSGKTTLAQYIYDSNKYNFESRCFLEEIGLRSKQPFGLFELQKQLLAAIFGGKDKTVSSISEGTAMINKAIHMKKVLLVLDDIDNHAELSVLLGTNAAHTQSKIIVTTRLLDIHSWFEPVSWRCHVHELGSLNDQDSLKVFSFHAFGSKLPLEGFSELAAEFAQYCGGNPLALKVLGSSVFVSAGDLRERNDIIESWRSRLNSLSSLKGNLDCVIQGVLQKSFDSLPHAIYKELFLHIVVFFLDEDEDYVVKIMEHDWHAKAGIRVLINRCLLTISPHKKLAMHQLLQEMGRNIVREDSTKLTRISCNDEFDRVLMKEDGSETTEGLTLDSRIISNGTKVLSIKMGSLAKMHKLKLLRLKYVKLSGNYKNFPELRWLCWHGCHLRTIPSGLLMSNFLVAIDMTNGNLVEFEPPMVLKSLKILDLKCCVKLVNIHKLCRLPNLETLILWNCINLNDVCKTIGDLANLALLDLRWCEKLLKGSWYTKLVNQQERLKALFIDGGILARPRLSLPLSLKFLFLDSCELEYDSDVRGVLIGPLFGLSLVGNLFKFIPNNIDLTMLRVLNLNYCKNLKSILCLPSTLEELYTFECKSLEKVTFQSARFRLRKFVFEGCNKLSEIQGLFKLVALQELDEADLGHMKWFKPYQDHIVRLCGDEKHCHMQMLYEYGIRSVFMLHTMDKSHVMTLSPDNYIPLYVPFHPKKHRIQGIQVVCSYSPSAPQDIMHRESDRKALFTIIANITKGVRWIYNSLVYLRTMYDTIAVWRSYWPIGSILDAGDEVRVSFVVDDGIINCGCEASFVYMDDDEVEQEKNCRENKTMKMEEVIGGDLSEFELETGTYWLCRHDIFKLATAEKTRQWFEDSFPYTKLEGWRKSYNPKYLDKSSMHLELYMEPLYRDTLSKGIMLVLNSDSDIGMIKNVVSTLVGVDIVCYFRKLSALYVKGCVDPIAVETCAREVEKTVKIIKVFYNVPKRRFYTV